MATSVHTGEVAAAHVSTEQWQSFELRMRRRRVERLLARVSADCEAGREDAAREAVTEIEQLSPFEPRLPELRDRVAALSAPALPTPPPQVREIEEPSPTTSIKPDEFTSFVEIPIVVPSAASAPSSPIVPLDLPLVVDEPEPSPAPALVEPEKRKSGRKLALAAAAILACGAFGYFAGPRLLTLVPHASAGQTPETPVATAARETAAPAPTSVEEARPTEPLTPVQVAVDQVAPANTTVETLPEEPASTPEPGLQPRSQENRFASLSDPPQPAPRSEPPPPVLPVSAGVSVPQSPTATTERPPVPLLMENTAPIPNVAPSPAPSAPPVPAVTTESSASTAVAPARRDAAESAPRDEDAIRVILDRYASAYSRLDAAAASAIFPGMDRRALARAFDGLAAQSVSLGNCDVRVASESAMVDCAGSATWTPKIGGGSRTEARRWQFRMRNQSGEWQIVAAKVR